MEKNGGKIVKYISCWRLEAGAYICQRILPLWPKRKWHPLDLGEWKEGGRNTWKRRLFEVIWDDFCSGFGVFCAREYSHAQVNRSEFIIRSIIIWTINICVCIEIWHLYICMTWRHSPALKDLTYSSSSHSSFASRKIFAMFLADAWRALRGACISDRTAPLSLSPARE